MSENKFVPLWNFVAVKPHEAKETTEGGLYIPDSAKSTPDYATVVAVGSGCANLMSEGDTVLVVKGAV